MIKILKWFKFFLYGGKRMSYLLELNDKIIAAENAVTEAKKTVVTKTAELTKLRELSWYCSNCAKHYPKESVTSSIEEVTKVEIVYTDAGYGDDDEIAEVTRAVTYLHCPVCGKKYAKGTGTYLREKNRHTRR